MARTWVDADEGALLLPLGAVRGRRQRGEEDEETGVPEGGEAGVVDGVEDGDQRPGLGGPAQDGAVVGVVEEVSEGLEPGPVPAGAMPGEYMPVRRSLGAWLSSSWLGAGHSRCPCIWAKHGLVL